MCYTASANGKDIPHPKKTTGRGAVRANTIKEVKKGIMKIYGYLLQLAAFNSITGIASPNKYLIDAIRNAQFEKKAN